MLAALWHGLPALGVTVSKGSKIPPKTATAPDQRVALVIGNGRYASAPLANPVNDARAMSRTLQGMGFRVTLLENATINQMSDAARNFGDALQRGGVGLFFYAGHGMQIKGRNYLIPVGADIQREDEVSFNAFDSALLLEKMEAAKSRVNIVILDACRNNPFSRSFRSASQGLAPMDAPVGSYLAFATAPARVASDGNDGNGLYTQHLLEAMRTPGLKIEEVFKRVRVKVMADSKGEQIPWDSSSLSGDFYFIPPNSGAGAGAANSMSLENLPAALPVAPARPAESKILLARISPGLDSQSASPPAPRVERAPGEAVAALYKKGMDAKSSGDLAAAADAFGRAVEGKHPAAAYELGMLFKAGRKPVTQDLARSQKLFLQAAEWGNAPAQYEVAQMLSQGLGVEKNCTQAIKWSQKAAEEGSPEAATLLGDLYKAECAGKKNPQEAARWYRAAAEKGFTNAQFSLGVLFMNGDGVTRDMKEARKWLTAASEKGNTSARFYLDRLGN
jgi:hypothetical protein